MLSQTMHHTHVGHYNFLKNYLLYKYVPVYTSLESVACDVVRYIKSTSIALDDWELGSVFRPITL